jgi:hypothetical protein
VYPLIRLFSFLIDKSACPLQIDLAGQRQPCALPAVDRLDTANLPIPLDPPKPTGLADASVPLIKLAVARSGDKGNHSNIGVMARDPDYLPWIAEALTPEVIVDWMSHVLDPVHGRVERWYLPATHSLNFLLENALGGGGVASLRIDPQGKAFAQQLLDIQIPVPQHIADQVN